MGYKCKEICREMSSACVVAVETCGIDISVAGVAEDKKQSVCFMVSGLDTSYIKEEGEMLPHDSASPDRISHCSGF